MTQRNRWQRAFSSWVGSDGDHAGDDEPARPARRGPVLAIADAPDRERVRVRGIVKTVVLRPRGGVPALEAELVDDTGSIVIIWLGRRRITGVDPGRDICVEGRIGVHADTRIIYNPRYELKS